MTISTPEESISNDYISHTSKIVPPYEIQQPTSTITTSSPIRPTTPGPTKAPRSSPPISPQTFSSSPKAAPIHPPTKEETIEPAKPQKKNKTIKREKEKPKKMCPRCGKGEWYGLCAVCGYPGRADLM